MTVGRNVFQPAAAIAGKPGASRESTAQASLETLADWQGSTAPAAP